MSKNEKVKLNKQLLNKIQNKYKNSPPKERVEVWDTEIKGFHLRVNTSGEVAYYLKGRIGKGRNAPGFRLKIGQPPMTMDKARDIAAKKYAMSLEGADPRDEKVDAETNPTLEQVRDIYLEQHARPHKSASQAEEDEQKFNNRILKHFTPSKRIRTFEKADIKKFHTSMKDTPYEANRYLALLSKTFNLCIELNKCDSNPCKGVKRYKEFSRERPLEMEELERVGERLQVLENERATRPHNIALIRMLLFSGRRLSDITELKRENMDWERNRYRKLTKGGDYEWLQFNTYCIEILRNIPEVEGNPYFFASVRECESGHMGNPRKFYDKLRKDCGIEDVRIHDLRHTHATVARACNMDLSLVGKLLGHKSHLTTKRYSHVYDMEKIQATEHVGNVIHSVFGTGAEGDVTDVQKAMTEIKAVIDKGNINPVALAQLVAAIQNLAPSVKVDDQQAVQVAGVITNLLTSAGSKVVPFPTEKIA